MPTSTPWLGRSSDGVDGVKTSPRRPSVEIIEQSSPTLFLSSHTSNHDHISQYTHEQPLFGLGLFGSSSIDGSSLVAQPDHLYIDQNGGAHIGAKVRPTSRSYKSSDLRLRDGRNGEARSGKATSKKAKNRNHTRSGSTIDDLANVAIATSPTFDNGSPSLPFSSNFNAKGTLRPATSYIDTYNTNDGSYDRPAKRVRSEKLHSVEWSLRDERPRTSHGLSPQTSMEDAKLLLGLRNGYSFSTNTSPVFASVSTFEPLPASDLVQVPITDAIPIDAIPISSQIEPAEDNSDSVQEEKIVETSHETPNQEEVRPAIEDMEVEKQLVEVAPGQRHITNDVLSTNNDSSSIADLPDIHKSVPSDTLEARSEPRPISTTKKPRKIKPEIQAEVCAACQKLQRDINSEDTATQWICCDFCGKWLHLACGGFKDKSETRSVDKFVCKDCEPLHGQTTFVRKSSRVRTAIDYAGLNQGVVKSSEESSLHHYIQPIKDRTIKYLDDNFARVRPELLTADFWENMDNMKRPFVVPACWNPRFGISENLEGAQDDRLLAEPVSDPSFIMFDGHGHKITQPPCSEKQPQTSVTADTTEEVVVDCDQDYLDMVMPRNLTVRRVAELYGPDQPVPVIDVKSQETKGQWTLSEWANYYEQQGEKPIRNVISLEVSNSPIGKLIRRPKAVRDIDLEDSVWDNETRTISNKRPVQFYCLMSVADSYTDFHIDFGGSSVYYHILKGVKTFFFIPPEDKYLKEYEKWCNSDTQNDTWLGDLCNGNVTRVDLHEGDTAFIPAGWMHSVWTPEDSLVIGGNFLTRLDYELQLKVANVEKSTKVPQKFRYPFFQKVMWYTLLKYLEEDPVPEEVLRDFHLDEDYRFLRANPIWYEFGELATDAEPGEAGHNARIYPKSELSGLPALRDYLYRTACIHADIHVPDINKKQIDAVKASIPKGHGDPMRLIKTFAVWCAWKRGNEIVPKWVHDQGDGLDTEIKEREKAKEETFRVPPERVSARNASKVKATSPPVELVTTPAKAPTTSDFNDSASVKSRSGSRGGSLRVACDACRKRRIKCRHKDGDDTAANSSPPEIRPRTYSNVSVDVPKLASASPVNSTFEQGPLLNGVMSDFNNTSDLAQAALATLSSQSSDPGQPAPTTPGSSSAKKGRSKACEECRKSKRRCVHDEYGRIDPAKVAEPSKPRGSMSSKRQSRPSDEHPTKRQKTESDTEHQYFDNSNTSDIDMMIDPALMGDAFVINAIHPPTESIVTQDEPSSDYTHTSVPPLPELELEDVPIMVKADPGDAPFDLHLASTPRDDARAQLHLELAESANSGRLMIPAHMRRSPEIDISYSPITVDGNIAESTERPDVSMEDAEPLYTGSRQPSPRPEHGDRNVPGEHTTPSKTDLKPDTHRRISSSTERTPETAAKSRRSSSNTSGTTHQVAAMDSKPGQLEEANPRPTSRGSSIGSDMNADEKFARELQAAENGLRRRASMRA